MELSAAHPSPTAPTAAHRQDVFDSANPVGRGGDEAVMALQDYVHMLANFRLIARRYGTVNRIVSFPTNPKSDDEVVQVYADATRNKTRLLLVCHIINKTGHILPVRKITDMARAAWP
jgi:selenocysteine lyase/cysteine desulfurase